MFLHKRKWGEIYNGELLSEALDDMNETNTRIVKRVQGPVTCLGCRAYVNTIIQCSADLPLNRIQFPSSCEAVFNSFKAGRRFDEDGFVANHIPWTFSKDKFGTTGWPRQVIST